MSEQYTVTIIEKRTIVVDAVKNGQKVTKNMIRQYCKENKHELLSIYGPYDKEAPNVE